MGRNTVIKLASDVLYRIKSEFTEHCPTQSSVYDAFYGASFK